MKRINEVIVADKIDDIITIILSGEIEADIKIGDVVIRGRECEGHPIVLFTKKKDSKNSGMVVKNAAKTLMSSLIFGGGSPFAIRKGVRFKPIKWAIVS